MSPAAALAPPPAPVDRAGGAPVADLDRRATAFAADRMLAWGVAGGCGYAVAVLAGRSAGTAVAVALGVLLIVGAVTGVVVGLTGLTPAKALLGLRVVRARDARPVGVGAGLLRTTVLGLAGLPTLGLGAATLGWSAASDPSGRRRGLHDRIGDAVVVDTRDRPVVVDADDPPPQVVNLTAMRLLPDPPAPEPVRSAAPPPPPPAPPGPPPRPAVRWQVAFDTGEAFEVAGLALVGREPEPGPGEQVRHVVPLTSATMAVSKTHAQFQVAPDGALVVMDRGSTNGSSILRRGLERPLSPGRPTTLVDGDDVRFGDRTMRVTRLG